MDETVYFSSQNFKFSLLNKTENCVSCILPKNAGFMFEEKVVKIKNECLFLKIFSLFLLPESSLSEGQYQPRSLPGFKAQSSFDCSSSTRYQDLYWLGQKVHLSFSIRLIEKFERTVWPFQ